MKSQIIAILTTILFTQLTAMAQWATVRNFTNNDHGGDTQTWSISQLNDERIIFANKAGLLIFDGDDWQLYYVDNHSSIYSLHYDEVLKRIYVGAQNEFGYFEFDDNGILRYYKLSNNLSHLPKDIGEIWHIHALPNRTIIFEAKNNCFVLSPNGSLRVVPITERIEHSVVINGELIIACFNNIYRLVGDRVERVPGTEPLNGELVHSILPFTTSEGEGILFVTADNGLWFYRNGKTTPYNIDMGIPDPTGALITPTLLQSHVFCATANKDYIAFGTVRNGVVLKSLSNGIVSIFNTQTGMQNNTVLSVHIDNDNNIWLGLDNGIDYMMLNSPIRQLLSSDEINRIGTGYTSLQTDQLLYLGSNQGLFCFIDNKGAAKREYHHVDGFSGQVWILRKLGDHLLCGADAGAFVVKGNHAQRIHGLQGTWDFKPLKGSDNLILTCDYLGFAILKVTPRGVEFGWRITGFEYGYNLFEIDSDGALWVSHWQKGVYRLSHTADWKHITKVEFFNSENCLPSDRDNKICKINNRVYISATDGFYRYEPRTHLLIKDNVISTIFSSVGNPLKVTQLSTGDLWGYKTGMLYFAKRSSNGDFRADSISTRRFTHKLQMDLGDIGEIMPGVPLFNSEKGYYIMSPHLDSHERAKHVLIRKVVSTLLPDSVLYSSFASGNQLSLPHNLNSLLIEFVMPEYSGRNNVEYTCKLEGFDKGWSAPQASTTKEYTQLGKGSYTFRVRARNLATGQEQETSLKINILPAWHETWWAYTIYALLLVVAIYYFFLYLKQRASRELRRTKIEQERKLREQQAQFEIAESKRQKELIELRNHQLELELKHKSGELADSIMNVVRKNDMLQEIDSQMEQLATAVKHDDRRSTVTKQIGDIRRGIRMNMNDDDNWEKFSENFNLVYDNFMHQLSTHFPDLKKNDLKLCAYLRMGLSSKEMASLLNTSVRSIETARYRLRKKLNLDQGANLTSFIQELNKSTAEEQG